MAKIGRPCKLIPDDWTLKLLCGLGRLMATTVEVATALGVSEPTLFKFFRDHPAARLELERGQALARLRLRQKQFELADRSNAEMLIWLGKQYLGQSKNGPVAWVETIDWAGAAESLAAKLKTGLDDRYVSRSSSCTLTLSLEADEVELK
jgi:hypothetical protein